MIRPLDFLLRPADLRRGAVEPGQPIDRAAELQRRIDQATRGFFATTVWLRIAAHHGPEGTCHLPQGHLLSLAE